MALRLLILHETDKYNKGLLSSHFSSIDSVSPSPECGDAHLGIQLVDLAYKLANSAQSSGPFPSRHLMLPYSYNPASIHSSRM
jgi:hypothetical protein